MVSEGKAGVEGDAKIFNCVGEGYWVILDVKLIGESRESFREDYEFGFCAVNFNSPFG